MRKLDLAAAAVAAVAALTSCGGGSSTSSRATTPSAAGSPSAQQNVAADKAAAAAAVLKIADLPTGWSTSTDEDDDDSDAADKKIAQCLGITVDELNEESPTEASSPDFEDADNHTISSTVEYAASVSKVDEEYAKAADPKVPGCLQDALGVYFDELIKHPKKGDELPEGVTIGKPRVGQLSFPTVGDRTLAYRVTVPIQAQGLTISAYVDIVLASKGRGEVDLTFESIGQPFAVQQEQKYVQLVVGRLTRTTDADAARPS